MCPLTYNFDSCLQLTLEYSASTNDIDKPKSEQRQSIEFQCRRLSHALQTVKIGFETPQNKTSEKSVNIEPSNV